MRTNIAITRWRAVRDAQFVPGNNVNLLFGGDAFFKALVAAINSASNEIYLETYIFANDACADRVKKALMRAAKRGCRVYVVTDWHGTGRTYTNILHAELHAAKVEHRSFNPWFHRGVTRLHRKLCVIDNTYGFVGGININDDCYSDDGCGRRLPAPRWDVAVRLSGPLVNILHAEVQAQWARLGPLALLDRLALFRRLHKKFLYVSNQPVVAGLVVCDNLRNRFMIQRVYLGALARARNRVLLATPYFAPSRRFRLALIDAAVRGVDVTLLIGIGEFAWQDAVARSFYPKLLASGVKIVEYRRTQLHGKVAVVDDDWSTVGSSNCDGFSLLVNHEANIVIKDASFADALAKYIEEGVAQGVKIALVDYTNIVWYKRAWYGVNFMVYRLVMRVLTLAGLM